MSAVRGMSARLSAARRSMSVHQWIRSFKSSLRTVHSKVRRAIVRRFFSFGPEEFVKALQEMGIRPGDSVMVHSSFEPHHGFRGTAGDAIDAFLAALGPEGHLLMVSMPFRGTASEYLSTLKCFDVRKVPSAMGMVSEVFRRRPGVLRSIHPSHPVLAFGPRAEWFVEGHERCSFPCGPGTPFEKLFQTGGKVAFFNVDFSVFTFVHYLEHLVSRKVGIRLYTGEPFDVPVIGRNGESITVRTYAFASEAIRRRRYPVLDRHLRSKGLIRSRRLGASRLLLVDLREIVSAVEDMTAQGVYFYAMESGAARPDSSP